MNRPPTCPAGAPPGARAARALALLLLAAVLAAGCGGDAPDATGAADAGDADEAAHPVVGVWRTTAMEVYLDAREGREGARRAISVSGDDWENTLGLAPPEHRFTEDGRYEAVYRDAEGREVERRTGYWAREGEGRISVVEVEPETERRQLRYTMRGELIMEFESWVDWNSDGEASDLRITSQRRLRTSELGDRSAGSGDASR